MMKSIKSIENLINSHKIEAILIGCSAGGLEALDFLFQDLPATYPLPIIICLHLAKDAGQYLSNYFSKSTTLPVHEAQDTQQIQAGNIYFAPGGYHLMIEANKTFSLDVGEKVNFARPSIDVLLETAAAVFKDTALACILTGSNKDGAKGAEAICRQGGLVLVEDPIHAAFPIMPTAVIDNKSYHAILSLIEIRNVLRSPLHGK